MTLPPESEWSNLDWLTALRADNDQAWTAIRERVLRSLRAYLRSRGRTLADDDLEALAEDAVQNTLLTVRAKLDTFRNDSRFTTWVHRIAVNALLGQLRQRRWNVRSPEAASDAVLDSLNEEGVPAPERAVLQQELWTLVRQLIEVELTPHQRTILLAHVFHQKPLDLLAAELGTSRDAVYKAIHDARRKLRAGLSRGVLPWPRRSGSSGRDRGHESRAVLEASPSHLRYEGRRDRLLRVLRPAPEIRRPRAGYC